MGIFLQIAMAGSFGAALLSVLYWQWRTYRLYRSLDGIKHRFSYLEFSFQFQSPQFARQLGGPMFRSELTPEQKSQVAAVARQVHPASMILGGCIFTIFVAMCVSVFARIS